MSLVKRYNEYTSHKTIFEGFQNFFDQFTYDNGIENSLMNCKVSLYLRGNIIFNNSIAEMFIEYIQDQYIWMNDLLKSKVGSSKSSAAAVKKENENIEIECKRRLEFFILQFSLHLDVGYQSPSVMHKLFSELEFFSKMILES